jgi:mRNA interferase RelE/StbE
LTDPSPFRVELTRNAQRQLQRLPARDAARLRGPILALAWVQRPPGSARLRDRDYWRLRIGDLRIVYAVDDERRLVIILRVARRNEATYRGLR